MARMGGTAWAWSYVLLLLLLLLARSALGAARLVCGDPAMPSGGWPAASYVVTAISSEAKQGVLARLKARFPEATVKDFATLPMFAGSKLTPAHLQQLLRDAGVEEIECDGGVHASGEL